MKKVVTRKPKPQAALETFAYEYTKLRQFIAVMQQEKPSVLNEKLLRNPQNEIYLVCRGNINLEKAPESAIQDLSAALRINPSNDLALSLRAKAYLTKNMPEKSFADVNAAIAMNPNNDVAFAHRGMMYCQMNRLDEALADLQKSLDIRNNSYATLWRGITYYQLGRLNQALPDLENSAQQASSAAFFTYLGMTYSQLYWQEKGNKTLCEKAIEALSKALKMNPRCELNLISRAKMHGELNNLQAAAEDLMLVIDFIHPSETAHFERGLIYKRWGYIERAMTDFNACIRLNPQNAEVYLQRGLVYLDPKKYAHIAAFKEFNKTQKLLNPGTQLQTVLDESFNRLFNEVAAFPDEVLQGLLLELSRDPDMIVNDNTMFIDFLQRLLIKKPHFSAISDLLANLSAPIQQVENEKITVEVDSITPAGISDEAAKIVNETEEAKEDSNQSLQIVLQEKEGVKTNIEDSVILEPVETSSFPETTMPHSELATTSESNIKEICVSVLEEPLLNDSDDSILSDCLKPNEEEEISSSQKREVSSFLYCDESLPQDSIEVKPTADNHLHAKEEVALLEIAEERPYQVENEESMFGVNTSKQVEEINPIVTNTDVISVRKETVAEALEKTLSCARSVLDNLKELRSEKNTSLTTSPTEFRSIFSLFPMNFGQGSVPTLLAKPNVPENQQQTFVGNNPVDGMIPAAKYLGIKQLVVYDKRYINERESFVYTDVLLQQIGNNTNSITPTVFQKSLRQGQVEIDYDFLTADSCIPDFSRFLRTTFVLAARKEQSFIPKENAEGRILLFLVEEEREFALKAVQSGIDVLILKSFRLGKLISPENMKLPFARRIALFIISRQLGLSSCMVLDDNIASYHLKKTGQEVFNFSDVYAAARNFSANEKSAVVCIRTRRYSKKRADSDFATERVAPKSFFYDLQAIAAVFKNYDAYQQLLPPNNNFRLYGEDYYFAAIFFHLGLLVHSLAEDEIVLSRSKLLKNKCLKEFNNEELQQWTKIENPEHFNEISQKAYADLCHCEQKGITYHNRRNAKINRTSLFGSAFKPQKSQQLPMPPIEEIREVLKEDRDLNPLLPHQKDAVKSFLERGTLTSLFELPTGTGKTLLFLKFIQLFRMHIKYFRQKNIAIIACDLTMAEQIKRAMEIYNEFLRGNSKNQAFNIELDVRIIGSGKDICQETFAAMRDVSEKGCHKIIIFCQRSFQYFVLSDKPEDAERNRRHQDLFNLVIFDEVHLIAPDLLKLCAENNPDRPKGWSVMGFDATPGRKGEAHFTLVHRLSIQEARQKSLIVPHIFKPYENVERFQEKLYEVITQTCDPRGFYLKDRQGIIYAPDIGVANNIGKKLQDQGLRVACFHYKISAVQREKLLQDYQQKKLNCLIAVSMLTVGFDGDVDYVIFLKKASKDQTKQQIGRALRKREADPTKIALVIGPEDLIEDPQLRNTLTGYEDSKNYSISPEFDSDSRFSEILRAEKRKDVSDYSSGNSQFFSKKARISVPQGTSSLQPITRSY